MRAWTRWEAWVSLIAGAYAALSTIWVDTINEGGAAVAMIVLGALLVLASVAAMAMPGQVSMEWAIVLFGALLFVSPWIFTYTDRGAAAWTSWIAGIVSVAVGLVAVPESSRAHREALPH